eukprot:TRINITY_DN11264_c0_g1_i2.p1 TRINITY_DN11264_c0_g1~~TRINITY_DN11264_c0_g1_i2.p1  ORF type:complete len:229 (+),score=37.26 TRINITY_DN11264_c0_g1_i2:43-729(+)
MCIRDRYQRRVRVVGGMKYRATLGVVLVLVLIGAVGADWKPQIPKKSDFPTKGQDGAILLDTFLDLQCPYSKKAYKTIKEVFADVGEKTLQWRMILNPLPFHHNAFLSAQGAYVVLNLTNEAMFWEYCDYMYQKQDYWSNFETADKTANEVIALFAGYANTCCGISTDAFIKKMGWLGPQNAQTRIVWELAASLGIYGTPMFSVNGARTELDSQTTKQQWLDFLAPLA